MKRNRPKGHRSSRDFVEVYTPVTLQVWVEKWQDIVSNRMKGA